MSSDHSNHIRKNWTVEVSIDQHEGLTRAKARLHFRTREEVGIGWARLDPADRNVPEIGDELAVARALSDLGKRMMGLAVEDIEAVTRQPAKFVC
ncbi:DUF1876 domain-containing protein [Mycolicibacterium sp. XJ879]